MKLSNMFTALGILSLTLNLSSYAGVGAGGGGNAIAQDFKSKALTVLDLLKTQAPAGEIDLQKLSEAIKTTDVEGTQTELFLQGAHKDCINYPDQKQILVSEKDWQSLGLVNQQFLALHEYLGILRVNDQDYQMTSKLLASEGDDLVILHLETTDPTNPGKFINEMTTGGFLIMRDESGSTLRTALSSVDSMKNDLSKYKADIESFPLHGKMISCPSNQLQPAGGTLYEYAINSHGDRVDLMKVDSKGNCVTLEGSPFIFISPNGSAGADNDLFAALF